MKLSKRVEKISASITLAISAKAKMMKEKGEPVIGFGAGEPDFDTPDYIKDAAKKAIDNGYTKYTPNAGMPDLKNAICEKFERDNGLKYKPNQIIVSNGAKQSLFNAICAICNEGDEVIIIAPYWVTYYEQISFTGAKPVIVYSNMNDGFKAPLKRIKDAITKKTKAIIINSPCNPTGAVCSKSELSGIAEIAVANDIFVISDEIYEEIIYDTEHISIASLGEEIKKKTIVINGVSKSYSMTGWRIGYAAAEKEIIDAMDRFQSHTTSNANSIAQKAAISALTGNKDAVKEMVRHFKERRDYIVNALNEIDGVKCNMPQGAFYVFPDISAHIGKTINGKRISGSLEFCEALLEEEMVAVVPGEDFGENNAVRLSYALSLDNIKTGIERFKKFILKLK
ncbi:MAG: pyridoxal phosphate-dependent aminotransferase [Elusimicrobiota bacterium]